MSTNQISQISISTSPEAEDAVAVLVESIFGIWPTIYTNVETAQSVITAYLQSNVREIKARRHEVAAGLERIKKCGLETGASKIAVGRVRREDWSESWKKYFKTIEIGSALLIKPSWSKHKPCPGQAVVVLDPGLSFGTGQHATTSFCLRQIVAQRKKGKGQSMLDIGCGSGILSISAARLGYSPVEAFDFDPVAVRVARRNCSVNGVASRVKLARADLTKLPVPPKRLFDLICANLVSDLLIAEHERILNRLAPGGVLVLAGVLATEFARVKGCYERAGLRLIKTKVEREWQSAAFRVGNPASSKTELRARR